MFLLFTFCSREVTEVSVMLELFRELELELDLEEEVGLECREEDDEEAGKLIEVLENLDLRGAVSHSIALTRARIDVAVEVHSFISFFFMTALLTMV